MNARYILFGIAAIYTAIAAWDYVRTGRVDQSRKTFLLVAAIFAFVALVLQLRQ